MDKNGTILPTFLPQYNDTRQFSHISCYFHFTEIPFHCGKLEKLLTYPMLCNLNFMTLSYIWQLARSLYIPKKHTCLRIKIYTLSHNWPFEMDVSDGKTEMFHSRHDSNLCYSETADKKSEGE
jgi:hypothetical protein